MFCGSLSYVQNYSLFSFLKVSFKKYFIHSFQSQSFRDTEREHLSFTGSLSKLASGCDGQGLARLKLKTKSFVQVSQVCVPSSGAAAGTWIGSEQPGYERAPMWNARVAGGGITCYATLLAPYPFCSKVSFRKEVMRNMLLTLS